MLHCRSRGPAGEEEHVPLPGRLRAHPAVVETEEIQPLATTLAQVHDPRLGRLRLQAEVGQQRRERPEGALGLLPGPTQHHQVIAVADQHAVPARIPFPVQPVQVDVAEQR